MNKLLLTTLSIALFFTACDKKETTPTPTPTPTVTIPADGWKLNTTSYKQIATIRQTSQYGVFSIDNTTNPSNFAAFFHSAYPTASGTYKIVGYKADTSSMSHPGQFIKDDEVIIVATVAQSSGPNKSHWSAGTDGKTATVTVTNGKLKIEVPEIVVISETNETGKATGTIKE